MYNKRGVSVWISWVLLMTFVVFLSALMANWMRSYAESEVDDVKSRIYDSQVCNGVSFYVKTVFQNSENLNIELVNNNLNKIDALMIRLYNDTSSMTEPIRVDMYLKPDVSSSLLISKVDYGMAGDIGAVELIPLVMLDEVEIICRNRLVEYEI